MNNNNFYFTIFVGHTSKIAVKTGKKLTNMAVDF
ncbi:uncharacterized protein METZ01_LOCUS458302 [marine metagenome]|uniref:Uncharacterized protein n=1 Tax=marine metagenome TaxID=408172 RepID=A0A383AEE8_9ZZZZ